MEADGELHVTRGKITRTFGEVTFNSKFDSGNLDRVDENQAPSQGTLSFSLWTAPDCAGTEYENGNRSWFYFSLTCQPPTEAGRNWHTIRMSIVNLNKQMRLYQQGLTPLIKTFPGRGTWERMRERPICEMNEEGMGLTFDYSPPEGKQRSVAYFAFCYPYSYAECQRYLNKVDKRMSTHNNQNKDSIYYHRQILCHSLDKLRVDLLTISSHHGITTETEPCLPGLYPDAVTTDLPKVFKNKKVVFVTSRVHPGETPSSYVFNGFLEFILNPDDQRSKALRQHFVFKMVPMLNPDGVQRGHYRTDSRGVNLNRVYIEPKWELHPAVFCIRSLIMYYHMGVVISHHGNTVMRHDTDPPTCDCAHLHTQTPAEEMTNKLNLPSIDKGRVALYVDLHAHATKRGCFMYGNHFSSLEDHAECMVLPKLVSLNSVHFDFSHCVFTERNMCAVEKRDGGAIGKEGSGRVAIYKATGLLQSYTLECNYNSGARMNGLSLATMDGGRATPPSSPTAIPYKYIPSNYVEVGRGLALALLDLHQLNPWPRLPNTEYSSLSGLRQALLHIVQDSREKPNGAKPRRAFSKPWNTGKKNSDNDEESSPVSTTELLQQETSNEDYQSNEALIQQSICLDQKRFTLSGQISRKVLIRRHTSPTLMIRPQSHKFIYNNSYSHFLGSPKMQQKYNNLSRSVQLPIVKPTRPVQQSLFHTIRKQTAERDLLTVPTNGHPLNLLNKFAVIGHKVLYQDAHSIETADSRKGRGSTFSFGHQTRVEQKNRKVMKSNKPKKLTAKPSSLLSRSKARRSCPPVTVSPEHHPAPIIQLTGRKK